MQLRRVMLRIGLLVLAAGWVFSAAAQAPQSSSELGAAPTIRAETRLVLVDTVVTDKKGNYLHDLTAKNFKVWEDNKEQAITSFAFGQDAASPSKSQRQYLVLFFDNSTMDFSDQNSARLAATKFIDANTGTDRLMAIVDFGGTVHIAQNFTSDTARLKQVVSGTKSSFVSPNGQPVEVASLGMPSLGHAEADFGARSVLLAIRTLAKSLASVPGRKSVVLFTSGFARTFENTSELTAAIDACNKANVAIYPIDARGLVAPVPTGPPTGANMEVPTSPRSAHLVPATFHYTGTGSPLNSLLRPMPPVVFLQRSTGGGGGVGGGGGGGGRPTGGTGSSGGGSSPGKGGTSGTGTGSGGHAPSTGTSGTGSRAPSGGGGVTPAGLYGLNPYNQPRQIVPNFPESASTNQQILYELADGTGGFVILNTNDLLGGLEKIAREQSEYYVLGYTPAEAAEGSCHSLRVKVDRGGTIVRSRSGYCKVRPKDLLAGNPIEKVMETHAEASMAGDVTGSMEAPFFFTSPNTARVNLALDIPSSAMKFAKEKGGMHSSVNVLGIAYKPDGAIGARFSDTVNFDLEKKELEAFNRQPYHYENQFEVASGQYSLKVVFSSGNESFGKMEMPLAVDTYTGKQFSISGIALSNDFHRVADLDTGLDAALLEDRTPLMVQGVQVNPSATNQFKKTDITAVYVEVYEPLLTGPKPPQLAVVLRVFDRKTGEKKLEGGVDDAASFIQAGNPVVPVGLRLPLDNLTPGLYRVDVHAVDSAGNSSPSRSVDFDVQ